jgi:hypothetical protein
VILASDSGFAGQEGNYAGTYSVTTSIADLGLSVTFSTTQATQYALVNASFYTQCNTASARNVVYYCNVDGANDSNAFVWLTNTSQNAVRAVWAYTWRVALSGAGSHTIKFQAVTSTTNGDFSVLGAVCLIVPCL